MTKKEGGPVRVVTNLNGTSLMILGDSTLKEGTDTLDEVELDMEAEILNAALIDFVKSRPGLSWLRANGVKP